MNAEGSAKDNTHTVSAEVITHSKCAAEEGCPQTEKREPAEKDTLEEAPSTENRKIRRPRKKRKVSSCATCRKFKTRCDFEYTVGKCYRCNILKLDCSLSFAKPGKDEPGVYALGLVEKDHPPCEDRDGQGSATLSISSHVTKDTVVSSGHDKESSTHTGLEERLGALERNFESMSNRIDCILNLLQDPTARLTHKPPLAPEQTDLTAEASTAPVGHTRTMGSNNTSVSHSLVGGYKLKECPFQILNHIDDVFFPLTTTSEKEAHDREQRPSAVARVNFLRYYEKHQFLCHKLVKQFLVNSHFWIIPGGVKEIDGNFARGHLFITSVYTIIAMCSEDNDRYAAEQEELYPLVERLLTNTLTMFDKLKDFDIEAILYCCMFHISKKSKRHRQLKYNALVLSNFALFTLLHNIDFDKIKERISSEQEYNMSDLYHLRILNSLTACYLEHSISYGTITVLPDTLRDLNNLTAKFPQSNFGDDIKISEINLADVVNTLFSNFGAYFRRLLATSITENLNNRILILAELQEWYDNWAELLARDGASVLLFTYNFYHTMILRSFLTEFSEELIGHPNFLDSILITMKKHCFSLLNGFLRLPASLIRGAPILTSSQLVYACLTLCDFLHWYNVTDRHQILNLCTRVYWHLNSIGEKSNEVTENVGKIIISIVTTSKTRASQIDLPLLQKGVLDIPGTESLKPPLRSVCDITSLPAHANLMRVGETTVDLTTLNSTVADSQKEDAEPSLLNNINRFDTFEDFFEEFLDQLKPNAKQIFEKPSSSAIFKEDRRSDVRK
ncbi:Urc2p KNAG_0F00190 [Huiozyma naganishii CBS 8797]|uniref:Zn(2)-C6 fungal-type domain-containing protein n=1 Tax=Huiozyma naganishii (strain ATCC MYA-139 / BCRC 22969 / CBS 8797 / KCTC 17520 / NBRC 10181 / NCYC 3082 / Yp74L-3) TaxID=1071383 RepID=J7S847_HUIN7|nr:hypothetical protein KNAG_0F00190 [Kazachstania naganishii CBS 8797]CCK70691.1 hypothetical protein KNAG_0F00190 [Kazachstania naganishii CBS 8797]